VGVRTVLWMGVYYPSLQRKITTMRCLLGKVFMILICHWSAISAMWITGAKQMLFCALCV